MTTKTKANGTNGSKVVTVPAACEHYGLNQKTARAWLRKHGETNEELGLVSRDEDGRYVFPSMTAARQALGL